MPKVAINFAHPEDLKRLPGIGPARAVKIVNFRSTRLITRQNFPELVRILKASGPGFDEMEFFHAIVFDDSSSVASTSYEDVVVP